MSKVLLIASNTMRDALRQKLVYLMALAGLGFDSIFKLHYEDGFGA